ncbi:MAG: NAD(P)-dependent oxidoreductase [Deltaproteobacteria bacterium]|nr:NAD(P)-dependent oxidoreductase [Deltaproteobacteria bacterium]
MTTIAWLGAGLLGSGFVQAALGRGITVRVWNRTHSKAQALVADGALACETAAEALFGADRVHVCLSDDESVRSVLEAVLAVLDPNVPVIDHTTVSPDGARERAQWLAAHGVRYVSAPVFMGPAAARNASGRMLVAGPASVRDAVRAELAAMTGELVDCGEDHGEPCKVKLLGNSLIIGLTALASDVLTLGVSMGMSAEVALAAMSGFPVAAMLSGRAKSMCNAEYTPGFELTMARKDLRLMLDQTGDRPLAALASVASRMDTLIAQGHGHADLAAIAIETFAPKKR